MPGNSRHDQSVTMRGPAAARVNRACEIEARHSQITTGLKRKLAHRTSIAPCSTNNIVDHPDTEDSREPYAANQPLVAPQSAWLYNCSFWRCDDDSSVLRKCRCARSAGFSGGATGVHTGCVSPLRHPYP